MDSRIARSLLEVVSTHERLSSSAARSLALVLCWLIILYSEYN